MFSYLTLLALSFFCLPPASLLPDHKAANGPGDVVSEMSKSIWSVFQDMNNHHWFGSDGQGVYRYDGKTLTRYPVQADTREIWIQSIYQDNRGDLWIGTNSAGVYKFNGKGFEKFRP